MRTHLGENLVGVQPRVPDIEVGLARELAHRLAIGPGRGQHDLTARLVGEGLAAGGDLQAGGEPFDVPLERAGQGLVEVVEVEQQMPFRGGEEPEVTQMRIATQLDLQPRMRRGRQIRRHHDRRTAVERERRGDHAAVPQWQQLRNTRGRLPLQQLDRIGPQ